MRATSKIRNRKLKPGTPETSEALSAIETGNLCRYEQTIAKGLHTFFEVGEALAAIKHEQLYRSAYSSFEQYCREKWDLSRMHAYRLLNAAEIYRLLPEGATPKPQLEAQVRPLTSVPKEQISAVWLEAIKRAGSARVTARIVEAAAADISKRTRRTPRKKTSSEPYWKTLVTGIMDEMRVAVSEERISDVQFHLERIRLVVEEIVLGGVHMDRCGLNACD